jgi:hypothetical protein
MYVYAIILFVLAGVLVLLGVPIIQGKIILAIVSGISGNCCYMRHARRIVRKFSTGQDSKIISAQNVAILEKKGGTTIIGVILLMIVEFVMSIVRS